MKQEIITFRTPHKKIMNKAFSKLKIKSRSTFINQAIEEKLAHEGFLTIHRVTIDKKTV